MNVTVTLPTSLLTEAVKNWVNVAKSDSAVRAAISALIEEALADGIPEPDFSIRPPDGDSVRSTVYLKPHVAVVIRGLAVNHQRPAAVICRALILKMIGARRGETLVGVDDVPDDHPIVLISNKLGGNRRVSQAHVYDNIIRSMDRMKIGVVEAGTGTGKTRAEVAALLHQITTAGDIGCIAVPTLQLMEQVFEEAKKQIALSNIDVELRPVRGRREFVSEARLRLLADSADEAVGTAIGDLITCWRRPATPDAWMSSTFERAFPELPASEVVLDETTLPTDLGYQRYRAQFALEEDGRPVLVLCTHAMLAQDARRRRRALNSDPVYKDLSASIYELLRSVKFLSGADKASVRSDVREMEVARQQYAAGLFETGGEGLLPRYRFLIVDEAHLLEPAFSQSFSDSLSINGLLRTLAAIRQAGGRHIKLELINRVREQVGCLKAIGTAGGFEEIGPGSPAVPALKDICAAIADALPKKLRPGTNTALDGHYRDLIRQVGIIRSSLNAPQGTKGYVSYSPHRAFPQIYVGPTSVERALKSIWDTVVGGAAVSATLYTPNSSGASARYQADLMGLAAERMAEYPPVFEPWTKSPVRMFAPSKDHVWPGPPAKDADDSEVLAWHQMIAKQIEAIWETSAGGVMALLTSHATAHAVSGLLNVPADCIVASNGETPLRSLVREFYEISHAGKKALWLAVGGAWTGLDLGGHTDAWAEVSGKHLDPQDDNLLTDLVIPRLPFGTNMSLSFRWRVNNRPNQSWHTLDAYFRLKQGLGRLVRRSGLPDTRRIWVLDGRMVDASDNIARAVFWHEVNSYGRIRRISPADIGRD